MRDAEKFFAGLKDPHSFGVQSYSPAEQIDQRTWIERLHDFKAHLWWRVRHFFRGQFTDEARDSFREEQGKLGKRSQVVGATQFAQIPLLNASQLVARWKLETPPALVSETQQLPIDGLGAGVYLIEATDGTYKAYTVAIVTSIAVVERTVNGQADLYVADRKTGAPVEKADVALWAERKLQSSGKTGQRRHGLADHDGARRSAGRGAGECVDSGAARGRCGAGDALELRLYGQQRAAGTRPISTPTGPSTGRDIRCTSRRSCAEKRTTRCVCRDERTLTLQVTDSDEQDGFQEGSARFGARNGGGGLDLPADAALGYYSIEFNGTAMRRRQAASMWRSTRSPSTR